MNMLKRLPREGRCRSVLLALGLLAGNLLFFLTIWMASKYDNVTLDQFIYQMKSSAAGANRSIFNSAVVRVGVFGVGSTLLQLMLYCLCAGKLRSAQSFPQFRSSKFARFVARRALPLTLAVMVFSASLFTVKLNLVRFVSAAATESMFIEDHYVDPSHGRPDLPGAEAEPRLHIPGEHGDHLRRDRSRRPHL